MKHSVLSRQRRFITPRAGDDLESIAARELPDLPLEEAKEKLQSWNLHIFLMRQPAGLVVGSDVVFTEEPLAEGPMTFGSLGGGE